MQRKRKQRRQDSLAWKRLIDTILDHTQTYIVKYSPEDQHILNDFLNVLKAYHVDKISSRTNLLTLFTEYIQKQQGKNEYLKIPFLWFSVYYFDRARLLLSVADFFAKEFYGYLAKQLKSFFQLIQKGTLLSDEDAWERLQYECSNIRVPLSAEELQVLESVYSLIQENEFHALNPSWIKASKIKNISIPNLSRRLANFYKLYDTKWYLLYYPPAFGLERLYFHFQLTENTSMNEIIDFHNSHNTVLCASYVHTVRGFPNSYIGLLNVPVQFATKLENYLQGCERQGKMVLHELTKVNQFQWTSSMALYQERKGWSNLSRSKWHQLVQSLKLPHPRKRRTRFESFFQTPPFNSNWQYRRHTHPSRIIKFYCDIAEEFSFDELSSELINKKQTNKSAPNEFELLKELIHKGVVHCGFRSYQLEYEWALDAYWVKIPQLTDNQLKRLLQWLPFSELYHSEHNIYLRVRLPLEFVQRIKKDLNWVIIPIIRHHYPLKLQFEYYDPKTHQWICPAILRTNF
ncbi:MAG: hypothetical protein ACFE9L_13815 [Candidatus Hodarchaeota archaeon]